VSILTRLRRRPKHQPRPRAYVVEDLGDHGWQFVLGTVDRAAALEEMAVVARLGGPSVYGPEGTRRLRVRAVTR
jgi:hypothetical protein